MLFPLFDVCMCTECGISFVFFLNGANLANFYTRLQIVFIHSSDYSYKENAQIWSGVKGFTDFTGASLQISTNFILLI